MAITLDGGMAQVFGMQWIKCTAVAFLVGAGAHCGATAGQRAMSISTGQASYSGGSASPVGTGNLTGKPGDTYLGSSLALKWDGAILTMQASSLSDADPEVPSWHWSAAASAFATGTGSHKLGARAVVTDNAQVQHVVEVPASGEISLTCQ